jgi:hypothetical protein
MSRFRIATLNEMQKAVAQRERFVDWTNVFAFAKKFYGEDVYKAVLEISRTYEPEQDWYLRMIHGYDQAGKKLMPNFDLPIWQSEYRPGITYKEALDAKEREVILHRSQIKSSVKDLPTAQEQALYETIDEALPSLYKVDSDQVFIHDDPLLNGEQSIILYVEEH